MLAGLFLSNWAFQMQKIFLELRNHLRCCCTFTCIFTTGLTGLVLVPGYQEVLEPEEDFLMVHKPSYNVQFRTSSALSFSFSSDKTASFVRKRRHHEKHHQTPGVRQNCVKQKDPLAVIKISLFRIKAQPPKIVTKKERDHTCNNLAFKNCNYEKKGNRMTHLNNLDV